MIALRGAIHVACFHHSCFVRAFGDAFSRRGCLGTRHSSFARGIVANKMRKKKVGDMRGEEACNKKVAECVEKNDFSMLKNVVVLKAPENSGKTTILKMVIEILYDRNPASWEGRGLARGNQFNRLRVTNYAEANRLSAEYSGIFDMNGVVVVVSTAGDFTQYIVGNFELFASANAVIGVTAVREGNIAEVAYTKFKSDLRFEETEIILSEKYDGKRWTNEEQKVAHKIVEAIDALIKEVR